MALSPHALREYAQPEIVRTSLEQVCLQVRALELAPGRAGGIQEFLARAITPPSERACSNALELLHRIGAIRQEDEQLTALGSCLAALPVGPQVGKALVIATLLGCLDPVATICAMLSLRGVFVTATDSRSKADARKRAFAKGYSSDHMAMLNAFREWEAAEREAPRAGQGFCRENLLNHAQLVQAREIKEQYIDIIRDAGLLRKEQGQAWPPPRGSSGLEDEEGGEQDDASKVSARRRDVDGTAAFLNAHASSWAVVKACLCAGLYPNVARVDMGPRHASLFIKNLGAVSPHPGSVSAGAPATAWRHRWAVYNEMARTTGGVVIYDMSQVSPLPLVLFGESQVRHATLPLRDAGQASPAHDEARRIVADVIRASGGEAKLHWLGHLLCRARPDLHKRLGRFSAFLLEQRFKLEEREGKCVVRDPGEHGAQHHGAPLLALQDWLYVGCPDPRVAALVVRARESLDKVLQRRLELRPRLPEEQRFVAALAAALDASDGASHEDRPQSTTRPTVPQLRRGAGGRRARPQRRGAAMATARVSSATPKGSKTR